MFAIAILTGIYSYLIFVLGVLGLLYKSVVFFVTASFIIASYLYFKRKPGDFPKINFKNEKVRPLFFIFLLLTGVNLIGALGPELAFDSLWYHLTLPKIFLENHSIDFIPGGLFYYSLMPKLSEMLYIGGLSFGSEVIPKLIHFSFGILTSIVIYGILRKFMDEKTSFLGVLIFYGNLVVGWESISSYVDLTRSFFEALALLGFIEFYQSKNKKWLIESAVMAGLSISTKLIALGSIPIFVMLLFLFEKNKTISFKNSLLFTFVSLSISLPWFVFSYINAGNPIYPIFTNLYPLEITKDLLNPINAIRDLFVLFFRADDPISPIYVILFPLLFFTINKFNKQQKIIAIYSLLALLVWYFTPRTGGGRFVLPYLPAFSILAMIAFSKIKQAFFKKYITFLIILVFFSTIAYRGIANAKFVPIILGTQTKQDFLSKNLNFDFGDFYDTDGFFAKTIKLEDKVLLYGFHNLYYINFPFIHESYVKKGDRFNYIATQNSELPKRFSRWNLIYENSTSHVKLYSIGGMMWTY